MKKLSKRNQFLILDGLKTVGFNHPDDPYFYIEENLYIKEAEEIHSFFKWLYAINRPCGTANIQTRWEEFKRGDLPPEKYYTLLYSFDYQINLKDRVLKNTANFTERINEPTLEEVRKIVKDCSQDNHYRFQIIDQDNNVINQFTHEQVFEAIPTVSNDDKEIETIVSLFENKLKEQTGFDLSDINQLKDSLKEILIIGKNTGQFDKVLNGLSSLSEPHKRIAPDGYKEIKTIHGTFRFGSYDEGLKIR